jgi:hypothetical protein
MNAQRGAGGRSIAVLTSASLFCLTATTDGAMRPPRSGVARLPIVPPAGSFPLLTHYAPRAFPGDPLSPPGRVRAAGPTAIVTAEGLSPPEGKGGQSSMNHEGCAREGPTRGTTLHSRFRPTSGSAAAHTH